VTVPVTGLCYPSDDSKKPQEKINNNRNFFMKHGLGK